MSQRYDMAKAYSARRLAVGAMVCPSCRLRIEEAADRCPRCGFHGGDTIRMFPHAAPPLVPVIDACGLLRPPDLCRIERRIRRLRRRLCQVRWCVCVVDLPEETNLRLFGFWMLNAAPVPPGGDETANAWTVLLLIDAGRQTASVSCGYALEPFVSDDFWLLSLDSMSDAWRCGRHGEAVLGFLDATEQELALAARRVERSLQRGGGR